MTETNSHSFNQNKHSLAVIIHGGAGKYHQERAQNKLPVLKEAIATAWEKLTANEPGENAVAAALKVLEASEHFNAGYGGYPNADGVVLLDIGLMRGLDRHFVALMNMQRIKLPSRVVLDMFDRSRPLFSVWTNELMDEVDNSSQELKDKYGWVATPEELVAPEAIEMLKKRETEFTDSRETHGTVGCVVRDINGNIAAGTSTGGITNKVNGRIGDSPIIGSGVFADNEICGLSTTGHGESLLRTLISGFVIARLRSELNKDKNIFNQNPDLLNLILKEEFQELKRKCEGVGGLIILPKNGRPNFDFISEQMTIAFKDVDDEDCFVATSDGNRYR